VAGLVAKEAVMLAADCTTGMDLNSCHITSLHAISPTCVSGSRGQISRNRFGSRSIVILLHVVT